MVRLTPVETGRGRKHESPSLAFHGSIYPILPSCPHPGSKKRKHSDQPVWVVSWTEAFSSSSRKARRREAGGCQGALRTAWASASIWVTDGNLLSWGLHNSDQHKFTQSQLSERNLNLHSVRRETPF